MWTEAVKVPEVTFIFELQEPKIHAHLLHWEFSNFFLEDEKDLFWPWCCCWWPFEYSIFISMTAIFSRIFHDEFGWEKWLRNPLTFLKGEPVVAYINSSDLTQIFLFFFRRGWKRNERRKFRETRKPQGLFVVRKIDGNCFKNHVLPIKWIQLWCTSFCYPKDQTTILS